MRYQNGIFTINRNIKFFFRQTLRAILILLILVPLLLEVYFVTPNIVEFTSGKEWVKVIVNSDIKEIFTETSNHSINHAKHSSSNGDFKKLKGSNLDNRLNLDSVNSNSIVLLLFNPLEYIFNEEELNEKNGESFSDGDGKQITKNDDLRDNFNALISFSASENKRIKDGDKNIANDSRNIDSSNSMTGLTGRKLVLKKDECDCNILKNSYIDKNPSSTDTGGSSWYILTPDGNNFLSKPVYIQMFALAILILRWMLVFNYAIFQLLVPVIGTENVFNRNIMKSNMISLIYFSSSSLTLSITGIEGRDCITWWFFGSEPEYILKSQLFVWLAASICVFIYLIQNILEKVFNISTNYKLVNDFITTFIYIPIGLILVISVSLCILGIIKPWIFLIWATSLIIELERNIRELSKLDTNESETLGTANNYNINNAPDQRNTRNDAQSIDEVIIVEMKEDKNFSENEDGESKQQTHDLVVIPVSNSYFKILDSNIESCCTKLCKWYLNHSNFGLSNNCCFNFENCEFNSKFLYISEFKFIELLNNNKHDLKYQNSSSFETEITPTTFSSFSSSSPFRVNSVESSESDSNNSQQSFICNICFLEYKSIVIFTPCGHGNVCINCLGEYISSRIKLKQYPKCHICREEINKMVEIEKSGCFCDAEQTDFCSLKDADVNSQSKIIQRAKVVAEITSNRRSSSNTIDSNNSLISNLNSQHSLSNNSSAYSSINKITLKISKRNSNLLVQPCIKELIQLNNQNQRFNPFNSFLCFISRNR